MSTRSRIFFGALVFVLGIPLACGKSEVSGGDGGAEPPDWAACGVNSDCVLRTARCCNVCGKPALGDVDAVNDERIDEHFADVCPEPVPCPACAESPNPDLHATCEDGACLALDIREHPASACISDDDCRLRVTGCCECGGSTASWDLIAINHDNEALYAGLVCDPGQGCNDCAPIYPSDVEAYCAPDGHCATRPTTDCSVTCAQQGMTCCGGECVLTYNDVRNCGGCGNACPESARYCNVSECTAPPCDGATCGGSDFCCGSECCASGELCCTVPGPGPSGSPGCYAPSEAGTCPTGCPLCQ